MMISESLVLFLLGQSIIIIGAIVAAYVATRVQMARMQENISSLKQQHLELSADVKSTNRRYSEVSGEVKMLGREISELFGALNRGSHGPGEGRH